MKIPDSTTKKLNNYQDTIHYMMGLISATDPNSATTLLNYFRSQFTSAQSDLFQDAYWKGDGKKQLPQIQSINQSVGDPIMTIQSDVQNRSSSDQIKADLGSAKAALIEADRQLTLLMNNIQSAA